MNKYLYYTVSKANNPEHSYKINMYHGMGDGRIVRPFDPLDCHNPELAELLMLAHLKQAGGDYSNYKLVQL